MPTNREIYLQLVDDCQANMAKNNRGFGMSRAAWRLVRAVAALVPANPRVPLTPGQLAQIRAYFFVFKSEWLDFLANRQQARIGPRDGGVFNTPNLYETGLARIIAFCYRDPPARNSGGD